MNSSDRRASSAVGLRPTASRNARSIFPSTVPSVSSLRASPAAHSRTCGAFIKNNACGATVVVGRTAWLTNGSGRSNVTIDPTNWLRFTVK